MSLGFGIQTKEITSDIDFYVRKIHRLESDLQTIEDQLSNTRIRVRKAEDFEYKYEVAARQNSKLIVQNQSLQREIRDLRVMVDSLRSDVQQLSAKSPRREREVRTERIKEQNLGKSFVKGLDDNEQVRTVQEEVEMWRQKFDKMQRQYEEKISYLKESFQNEGFRTHEKLTRDQQGNVEALKQEVSKYKKLYEEKANMDDFIMQKIERIKTEKDKEIQRLNNIIQVQYKDMEVRSQESTQEVLSVKNKYTKMLNLELQKIHSAMDNQDGMFQAELSSLRKVIQLKQEDIEHTLKLMTSNTDKHQAERQKLKNEIKKLQEVLYQVQRENEVELFNLKERLNSINSDEVQKLTSLYETNKVMMKEENQHLQVLMRKKEDQHRNGLREMERVCGALEEKVEERDHRINQLLQKIANTGNQNSTDVREISHTMHKIKEQKQEVSTGLSDNITFKNLQIKKLTESMQLKNIEIKNLYNDVAYLKKQIGDVKKELEAKWKQERKDREVEREALREQIEGLESDWKVKQRQWKMKQKSYLNEKQILQRQNLKLRLSRDQMEKTNADLISQIKDVDILYKKQVKKNHIFTLDTGGLRRQLMHEIEKQQIDFEIMKQQESEDLKKKHEIEVDRLRFEVSALQTALNSKSIEADKLVTQLKKHDVNSEKVVKGIEQEYHKKLAALNSEIFLTQNLYNSFIESKSRIRKENA